MGVLVLFVHLFVLLFVSLQCSAVSSTQGEKELREIRQSGIQGTKISQIKVYASAEHLGIA